MEITHSYNNGTVTGTTTTAYVQALVINNCAGAVVQIKDTGATYDLLYKIDGYISLNPLCIPTAIVAETTLGQTVASGLLTSINSPYAKVVISVMNAETTNVTTYQIDWIAY